MTPVPTTLVKKKMNEINIEVKVLREIHSKQPLNELNPKQRQELQIFCETWKDILAHLSSISDFSRAKEHIIQMALKKYGHSSISAYLRSELFYWIAYRNREGSSFDTK